MNTERLSAVRRKIDALDSVPTIPAIVQPLAKLLQMPTEDVPLDKVIELVSYDSTIAAQCLRMANSPLFGRRNVETVRSAVVALGLKRIQSTLLACTLNNIIPADKWVLDATTFWRHSMGCGLVSLRLAKLIGYADPEKAYLAGLVHDLGILVNTLTFPEEFRQCLQEARERQMALHPLEQERLGFTHGQSGKLLAERWHFSPDMLAVIEYHHNFAEGPSAQSLLPLVNLSDLLCRVCGLGYGYYEAMRVNLGQEAAWAALVEHYPALGKMDLARFTLDIDGAMGEIAAAVDAVFGVHEPTPA